jgi:predicted dehydrogenase
VILEFPSGKAVFAVGTQIAGFQRMHILGTAGHMEVMIPFNAPHDRPGTVAQDRGSILLDEVTRHEFPVTNQYTRMADDFARAITGDTDVPVSLEDALFNTKVLCAIFDSAAQGSWVDVK